MNYSKNMNRHKENFQFFGNSYQDKNAPKKQNKATLEISGSDISPSPIKLKSLSHLKKDQIPNFTNDSKQLISPSRSNKEHLPDFLNDQIKFISPSNSSKSQAPVLLNSKNLFISPSQSNKEQIQSILTNPKTIDSPSLSGIDQTQKVTDSPTVALSKNNVQSYEMKYKKARQKIKGMKIIIDVLNARVQKAISSKQEIEKQVLDLKQQLNEQFQNQIISNNGSILQSVAVSPKSQSKIQSEIEPSSLVSSDIQDKDRINNVFDKISRFEQTCDSAIQAFSEFQSFISSSSQIQDPNVSNRSMNLSVGSANSSIQNPSIEALKKKNKQLQHKINENNETILQLNAKIRRRENENSMLKQQLNDIQDSYDLSRRVSDTKQKRAEDYLCNLQERYSKMQEEGDSSVSNKNPDIIHILKENEALANRVKELSMKNSELVRLIYKMQKGTPDENKPRDNLQIKNESTSSPKDAQPLMDKSLSSPKDLPGKVDIPMSVKYSFNQENEEKSQDDSGVSCFIE